MIDVVTWLDNNEYRNELSAVCAGNGIRIVADEFENAEETHKPLTPPPECRTIGIMGLTHGCGVTNMAINIASYISLSEDYNVKAVDLSGTGSMRFAKGRKVTYIVHSDIDFGRLKKSSCAVFRNHSLYRDGGTPITFLNTNEK